MIKIVSLIRRNPALSPQAFRRYWTDVHAPMVRAALPGLVHYSGGFPLADAHGTVEVAAMDYDAVVEMGFADRATMERDMGGAAFQTAERHASSAWLMDFAGSRSMVVEMVEGLGRTPGS